MSECVHKRLCANECPCYYYEPIDGTEAIGKEKETATLETVYGGSCVVWAKCSKCGEYMKYPTDRPFNVCPYCKTTIHYD